jgi:hypothetical protein
MARPLAHAWQTLGEFSIKRGRRGGMGNELAKRAAKWKSDPVLFIRQVLRDPEAGKPFELYPAQARFLREALTPTADGRLPFPECIFSGPKKSGKTATAAMAVLYVVICLGGRYAEGYCVAMTLTRLRAECSKLS